MYSMVKPCLYMYKAKYQVIIKSCAIKVCDFDFNPRKENTFKGELAYIFGDLGRS